MEPAQGLSRKELRAMMPSRTVIKAKMTLIADKGAWTPGEVEERFSEVHEMIQKRLECLLALRAAGDKNLVLLSKHEATCKKWMNEYLPKLKEDALEKLEGAELKNDTQIGENSSPEAHQDQKDNADAVLAISEATVTDPESNTNISKSDDRQAQQDNANIIPDIPSMAFARLEISTDTNKLEVKEAQGDNADTFLVNPDSSVAIQDTDDDVDGGDVLNSDSPTSKVDPTDPAAEFEMIESSELSEHNGPRPGWWNPFSR
ncbi:hypothetical protein P154DRAFT_615554 [Amniculicola lignicola CBS 123094]|uniref:Uncharacterized protein n=1 Tax=Amniculicola lignicola CBS 123094 TaxID=1392246 RepID=A0A6A5X1Z4_9PLEO|nr:hypothetical protein P154DRAFT_615554 [Amniculicola lignicola CBS 123094]